jgi:predicted metal-dependent hydrolase
MTGTGCSHNRQAIVYGGKEIEYHLFYVDRKTLEISVHPDMSVIVKAPLSSDIALIEQKIIKRARWVLRQLRYFDQFQPRTPERCYVSGESHLYLGKQYRLKVQEGAEASVKLSRGIFQVVCLNSTPELVKELLLQWYTDKARTQFAASLDRCWLKFKNMDADRPNLSIRRMQKRWGSLSKSGTLTLNTDLIRAPRECIDYVVMHELCHLKYHDHGPEFYKLLDSVSPGWEKVKHKLELSLV